MNGDDARKLAGFLEDCSWAEGEPSPEARKALWLAAVWLDHQGKALEAAGAEGPASLPPDDRFRPSDFARGCPADVAGGPAMQLGSEGPIIAGDDLGRLFED